MAISNICFYRDRAAQFFYTSARSLMTPHWKSTSVWLKTISDCKSPLFSTPQKISSVAKSALLSWFLLPFTLGGLALGQAFHFTAFNLAARPYIHLTGNAEVQNSSNEK